MSHSPETAGSDPSLRRYVEGWQATMRMLKQGKSWSGRERNSIFLNCGGAPFADVSSASGLDFADDGRAVAVVDWDHDGDLDLWLRNRTGPRLRLMLNRSERNAAAHRFVEFRLQGTEGNRDAIGARVEVRLADGTRLLRSLTAGDGFLAQSSKWLHVGLGRDPGELQVIARWPGGRTEQFGGVRAGRRYLLEEGSGEAVEWKPPSREPALLAAQQPATDATDAAGVLLPVRMSLPTLQHGQFDDAAPRAIPADGAARLVNFWASWCSPCVAELTEWTERAGELREAGLEILALSVDGMAPDDTTGPEDARALLSKIGFPHASGTATDDLLGELELVQELLFDRTPPFVVPMSVLLDRTGRLAAVYRGRVDVERLLRDLALIDAPAASLREASVPFSGRWLLPAEAGAAWIAELEAEYVRRRLDSGRALEAQGKLDRAATHFLRATEMRPGDARARLRLGGVLEALGHMDPAEDEYREALRVEPDSVDARVQLGGLLFATDRFVEAVGLYREALRTEPDSVEVHQSLGNALFAMGKPGEAASSYRKVLELQPDDAPAHLNLGNALAVQGSRETAVEHFREALRIDPGYARAHTSLGRELAAMGRGAEAIPHYRRALEIDPGHVEAQHRLGWELKNQGRLDEAAASLRASLRLEPDHVPSLMGLGWILTTHPDESRRKPDEAIRVVERASRLTGGENPLVLDMLATAYAAAGQVDRAIETAERAASLASAAGAEDLARRIRARLATYRSPQP